VRSHAYMGRVACAGVIFFSYLGSTIFITAPMLLGVKEEDIFNVTEGKTLEYPIPSEFVMTIIKLPDNLYFMISIIEYLMLLFTCTGNLGKESCDYQKPYELIP
jgi:hypothetical protein